MNPSGEGQFPKVLDGPVDDLTVLDHRLIQRAVEASRRSPRGRVILPLHKSHAAPLQRMLNAMQPGSYVQPHRHLTPPKAESIVLLQGALRYVAFTDEGEVDRVIDLGPGGDVGVDTEAGIFHTFFATAPNTVVFEAKVGPYQATSDKDFAPWAPDEGDPEAAEYLRKLEDLPPQPEGS